ncbi:hypothetical protein Tco_1261473 [Tanacetum coccineum]
MLEVIIYDSHLIMYDRDNNTSEHPHKHPGVIDLASWSGCLALSATLMSLGNRPACHSSLVSCLSSLGESLPSVPGAYGQTLEAMPPQPAASGNESHIPGVVSG